MRRTAGRMIGRVPVVPGDQTLIEPEVRPVPSCTACGYGDRNGVLRTHHVIEGIEMLLCLDYLACCRRYRGAAGSPAVFAAMLRNAA
jgi:hypothetical protein